MVASQRNPLRYTIACLRDGDFAALPLSGGRLGLFVDHRVEVDGDRVHTQTYSYRLQLADDADAWALRWEYLRVRPPGYRYVLGHLHVNGALVDSSVGDLAARQLPRLHLATGRVAFELVLRHLIAEWGVQPKTEDWEMILDKSLAGFEERRNVP